MNIETEFLKFKYTDDSFPDYARKNYISIYNVLKTQFDTQIHPEIKTKILEIEKSGFYNDHGVDHIKMVVDRVSRLISLLNPTFKKIESKNKNLEKFYISPYEIFILLMAINLHDAGHLIASRDDHAKKGTELLSRFDSADLLDRGEKIAIGKIAKVHGGKDDPISRLEPVLSLSNSNIRPQFLAALLRLGDELAEDKSRASNLLLKLKDENTYDKETIMDPTSELYHRFSACLDSISLDNHEIKLHFYVLEDQLLSEYPKVINKKGDIINQFLLDEIYKRTLKTFTETLYCNRYFPASMRFNSVIGEIHLLTKYQEEIHEPIKFFLKENGYPLLQSDDIFELCGKDLIKSNGDKIDGNYIANLIKTRNGQPI
ncbi:HD domain-containing protein [Emticicia agri]|uniref:HD-CE domain-containing protein n=1 Tax=Emticicia agri TaxID=2492393 RepID=A0A4Q5LU38_9BACT|nr:hypothetical protein [Emticicia agri]RYU93168.1 hypothetical protein EWM59_23335 [Emticicia agri]